MKKYERVRDICSKVKFQNIGDERGDPSWCVAWSTLYRAKHVSRLELVEGKVSKQGKIFDKVSGFISGILFFSQNKQSQRLNGAVIAVTAVSCQMMPSEVRFFAWRENIWH